MDQNAHGLPESDIISTGFCDHIKAKWITEYNEINGLHQGLARLVRDGEDDVLVCDEAFPKVNSGGTISEALIIAQHHCEGVLTAVALALDDLWYIPENEGINMLNNARDTSILNDNDCFAYNLTKIDNKLYITWSYFAFNGEYLRDEMLIAQYTSVEGKYDEFQSFLRKEEDEEEE